MAVVSRIGKITITNSTGTSTRVFTATADVQDTAAGSSVLVTITQATTGALFAAVPDTLTLNFYTDSGAVIKTVALNATSASQTDTFFFTATGLTGGAARSGTVEIALRATKTTGLGTETYDIESDGSPNTPPSTHTTALDRGWVRGTTTALTTLNAATFAYGDTITATTTLGAAPFQSRTLSVKLGSLAAVASAASTSAVFTTAQGVTDNRFAASATTPATVLTFPNATLTALPWTTATITETSATVDPRLTVTHLMQVNDNLFGTPPMSKDTGAQRLTSDLAFLDSRFTNAAGVGINGINFTVTLQDAQALVTALTRTATTATAGGEAGWGPAFLTWDSALPTGTWNKTTVINSPAATGLESGGSKAYSLVAANPNLRLVAGAGPATTGTDSRHFAPGVPLLIGVAIFNTNTNMTTPADSGTAKAALGRFSLTLGRAEFLDSDGVWKATNGVVVYYWPLTASAGDSNVFIASFADTSTWGVADMFVIGKAQVAGVPVSSFQKEITVNGVNNHTAYEFDGAGFVGFPSR